MTAPPPARARRGLGVLLLVLGSFVLLAVMTRFDPDAMLYDDNANQWLPVIDLAFADLLRGSLPMINPHQFGGVGIVDVGYYSVSNPGMLLAYVIQHALVPASNTITVYIYLTYAAGNVAGYLLVREAGLRPLMGTALTAAYATTSPYVLHGHWYYVFTNHVLLPLLLLLTLKALRARGSLLRRAAPIGLTLAASTYLGNAQYAVYGFVALGVVLATVFALGPERNGTVRLGLLSLAVALVASLPQILLLLRASSASFDFAGVNPAFFELPLAPDHFLRWALWPFGPAPRAAARDPQPYLNQDVMFLGALLVLAAGGAALLLRGRRTRASQPVAAVTAGAALAAGLFLCIAFAVAPVVQVLSQLPVVGGFRYLFKALFVLPPLLLLPAAHLLAHSRRRAVAGALVGACVLSAVAGVVHARRAVPDVTPPDPETATLALVAAGVELQGHRVLGVLGPDAFNSSFRPAERLTRNGATYVGAYAPGGYQVALERSRRRLTAPLFGPMPDSHQLNGAGRGSPLLGTWQPSVTSEFVELSVDRRAWWTQPGSSGGVLHRRDGGVLFPRGATDPQIRRALVGIPLRFSTAADGAVLAPELVLEAGGTISGHHHPNERRWDVQDGRLRLLTAAVRPRAVEDLGPTLVDAAVGYLVVDRDSEHQQRLLAELQKRPEVRVSSVRPYLAVYSLVELEGIRRLVSDRARPTERLAWSSSTTGFRIDNQRVDATLDVQFAYDQRYRCRNDAGGACRLAPHRGYLELRVERPGTVHLDYVDRLAQASYVSSAATFLLLGLVMWGRGGRLIVAAAGRAVARAERPRTAGTPSRARPALDRISATRSWGSGP